jgi:cardiolipin synthase (CMP-forming)
VANLQGTVSQFVAAMPLCYQLTPKTKGLPALTIPNFITIGRFLMVPLVVWSLLNGQYALAFACFLIAGISDGVDGFIARHFDMRSKLGSWLDPAADKILLVSVYIMLGWLGEIPDWLVVLVVSRDAMIVGAIILSSIMGTAVEMKPLLVSKANTFVQIALAALVLAELALVGAMPQTREFVVYVTAFLTFASGIAYVRGWMRLMSAEN